MFYGIFVYLLILVQGFQTCATFWHRINSLFSHGCIRPVLFKWWVAAHHREQKRAISLKVMFPKLLLGSAAVIAAQGAFRDTLPLKYFILPNNNKETSETVMLLHKVRQNAVNSHVFAFAAAINFEAQEYIVVTVLIRYYFSSFEI